MKMSEFFIASGPMLEARRIETKVDNVVPNVEGLLLYVLIFLNVRPIKSKKCR